MNYENYDPEEYYRIKEAEHMELVDALGELIKWVLIGLVIYGLAYLFKKI